MDITDDDLDSLRHMVGAKSTKKRDWGFRNFFAPGADDVPSMQRLEAVGCVRQGRPYGDAHYYHATEEGCQRAGLNAKQTKRAMGGT